MSPKPLLLLMIILFIKINGFSQTDSVMYTPGKVMEDVIYLTYEDFRHNHGITKDQVVSSLDKSQLEFLGKIMFGEKFSYNANGTVVSTETKKAWGYFQNNTLHVNYKGDFYRIPVFGSISYLVANVTVINPGFYDPRFGYSTGSTTTKEIREFLVNFYEGILKEFSISLAEELLARDKTLFEEYKKLGHRKQKEQVYRYIRKYNELHPVYFLK
jgi:hypothetical protein